jgi:hypothetical protein
MAPLTEPVLPFPLSVPLGHYSLGPTFVKRSGVSVQHRGAPNSLHAQPSGLHHMPVDILAESYEFVKRMLKLVYAKVARQVR